MPYQHQSSLSARRVATPTLYTETDAIIHTWLVHGENQALRPQSCILGSECLTLGATWPRAIRMARQGISLPCLALLLIWKRCIQRFYIVHTCVLTVQQAAKSYDLVLGKTLLDCKRIPPPAPLPSFNRSVGEFVYLLHDQRLFWATRS